jgi:DNA-binding transcriptional LysR family regulator
VDLVLSCQSFVSVAERGSFTLGAARVGIDQSAASRRVAALEQHLGGPVLDRSARRPTLTPLGRRLLPAARRLLDAAELLRLEAEDARLSEVELAVPAGWDVRDLAALELAGRDHDLHVVPRGAGVAERPDLLATGSVGAALLACPPAEATWRVPLGLAGATASPTHLDRLRPGRLDPGPAARVWILAEDDVPHVRDRLAAAAERTGLSPAQVVVARTPQAGVAAVLGSHDLLLTSAHEARLLELAWSPLRSPALARGYVLASGPQVGAALLAAAVGEELAHALGVPS